MLNLQVIPALILAAGILLEIPVMAQPSCASVFSEYSSPVSTLAFDIIKRNDPDDITPQEKLALTKMINALFASSNPIDAPALLRVANEPSWLLYAGIVDANDIHHGLFAYAKKFIDQGSMKSSDHKTREVFQKILEKYIIIHPTRYQISPYGDRTPVSDPNQPLQLKRIKDIIEILPAEEKQKFVDNIMKVWPTAGTDYWFAVETYYLSLGYKKEDIPRARKVPFTGLQGF